MLLTGTHERNLDDKKRLALPRKVRDVMQNPDMVFVTPGPDKCLWLYTQSGLEALAERMDAVPATDGEGRVFRRLYFAQTESVEIIAEITPGSASGKITVRNVWLRVAPRSAEASSIEFGTRSSAACIGRIM